MNHVTQALAATGQPLFGNQWLAILVILAGVAVFIALVALVGRLLAASHPEQPKKVAPPQQDSQTQEIIMTTTSTSAMSASDCPPPHILAAIAAAIATTVGPNARITNVQPAPVGVEALMQLWSLEGRRQIYTSHNPR